MKSLDSLIALIIAFLIGLAIGVYLGYINTKPETTRPVEGSDKVDSRIKVNDSIKIVVNDLDSIKNAKIIEVQTLDNDSTVKLFYELISK